MSKAAAFLLSATLAGCASAPGYRAPDVLVPAAFRETRDTLIAIAEPQSADSGAPSWPDVGDTTLARLVKEVVRENLDVRAAEARVRGARSARAEAAFDLAPTVTLGGGYTRQRLAGASFPIGVGRLGRSTRGTTPEDGEGNGRIEGVAAGRSVRGAGVRPP